MHYSEVIRGLREDYDLTQKQVAAILNVCQKTYSDYETNRIRLPIEGLIKLAQFYNVDLNYITGVSRKIRNYPTE